MGIKIKKCLAVQCGFVIQGKGVAPSEGGPEKNNINI